MAVTVSSCLRTAAPESHLRITIPPVSTVKPSTIPLKRSEAGAETPTLLKSEEIDYFVGTPGGRSSRDAPRRLKSEEIDYESTIRHRPCSCPCWRRTMKTSNTPLEQHQELDRPLPRDLNSEDIDYPVGTRTQPSIARDTPRRGLNSKEIDYTAERRASVYRTSRDVKTSTSSLKYAEGVPGGRVRAGISPVKTDGVRGPGLGSLESEGIESTGKASDERRISTIDRSGLTVKVSTTPLKIQGV